MKTIRKERQDDFRRLEEVHKICDYFSDFHVKEVTTYDRRVADCFCDLGYNVEEKNSGEWTIRRVIEEIEDIGYDF